MSGRARTITIAALIIVAFIVWFLLRGGGDSPPPAGDVAEQAQPGRVQAEGADKERPFGHITSGSVMLKELEPLYNAYFDVQMALAGDDLEQAVGAYQNLEKITGDIDMTVFKHPVNDFWMETSAEILKYSAEGAQSGDIDGARDSFYHLSKSVIVLQERIGHSNGDFYLTFCPVARDSTGAYWIQEIDTVYNSFYGAVRLRCGSIEEKLPAAGGE